MSLVARWREARPPAGMPWAQRLGYRLGYLRAARDPKVRVMLAELEAMKRDGRLVRRPDGAWERPT